MTTIYNDDACMRSLGNPSNPGDSFGGRRIVKYTTNATLKFSDASCIIECDSATPMTLTVPAFVLVAFEEGVFFEIVQNGIGKVTIVAGAGVTIDSSNLVLNNKGTSAFLYRRGAVNNYVFANTPIQLITTKYASTKAAGNTLATTMMDGSTVIVSTDESAVLIGTRTAYTVISGVLTAPIPLGSGMVTPSSYGIPYETQSLVNQDAAFATLSALIAPAKIWLDGRYRVSSSAIATYLPRCAGHGSLNGLNVNNDKPILNEKIVRPIWFTWDSGIKPYYTLSNTWAIDVAPYSFDVAFLAVSKVTKYVDVTLGNDSNTGDAAGSGTAWKSVNKALTWAKLNQATVPNLVIMVQAGTYKRLDFWVAANAMPTIQNISIRAVGGAVVLSKEFEAQTWTVASGSIYQATRSSITNVWDSLNLDSHGYWTRMQYMGTTLASVVAPGQWATNGTTVWVWNIANRAPDTNNRLMLTGAGCYSTNLVGTLFCDGITFIGGDISMFVSTNNSTTSKQYFNNCFLGYSTSSNGLGVSGTDGCYIFNSTVSRANRDGLNYHLNADGLKNCKIFEFNVISKYNGMSGDSNNNASTGHDGAIIQRVGGEYAYSEGPNVPDVNGCLVWNTGCVIHDSLSPESGTRYGMYAQGAGKLHCDFVTAYGHIGNVVVDATSGAQFTTRGWNGDLDIVYI